MNPILLTIVAIIGAQVHTNNGPPMEGATVLIKNGRIVSVVQTFRSCLRLEKGCPGTRVDAWVHRPVDAVRTRGDLGDSTRGMEMLGLPEASGLLTGSLTAIILKVM